MGSVQVVALSLLVLVISCAALNNQEPVSNVSKSANIVRTSTNSTVAKNSTLVAEGGIISTAGTHQSREHVTNEQIPKTQSVIEKPSVNATNSTPTEAKPPTVNATKPVDFKPVYENKTIIDLPKDDNKTSVPKKGVSDVPVLAPSSAAPINISSTTSKPSTTSKQTQKPMKPRITESDDVILEAKVEEKGSASRLTNIDSALEKRSKRSDYVVPIIAVILSVPLVAIVISLVYKRGAYWWQHRNYRRMDYLIEGIYNN